MVSGAHLEKREAIGTRNRVYVNVLPRRVIGVEPSGIDATDRARIIPLAEELRHRGLPIKLVEPKETVFLRVLAKRDYSVRGRFEEHCIFDVSDSILTPTDMGFMRNWKFRLCLYPKIVRFLRSLDLVVAGSEEQKQYFDRYVRSVCIPDAAIYLERGGTAVEIRSEPRDSLIFVWDGQGHNFPFVENIVRQNLDLFRRDNIRLLVVTDKWDYLLKRDNEDVLRDLRVNAMFRKWSRESYIEDIAQGHVGLAPVDTGSRFALAKPDNKAVGYLSLAMPSICSATRAYVDLAARCSAVTICRDSEEWRRGIEHWSMRRRDVANMGRVGRLFVANSYSVPRIADKWMEILIPYLA